MGDDILLRQFDRPVGRGPVEVRACRRLQAAWVPGSSLFHPSKCQHTSAPRGTSRHRDSSANMTEA